MTTSAAGSLFHPRDVWEGMKPVTLMLLVQALYAGVAVCYRLAAEQGLNLRVDIAYRYMFAAAFTGPLAFVVERKGSPKLTWIVLCQAFICGALGGMVAQNLYAQSIAMTSATYAVAMSNLVPAFTFIIAVGEATVKRPEGMAKVVGTMIGIGGAMVLTFYKGKEVHLWTTHIRILHHQGRHPSHDGSSQWIAGSVMSVGSCVSYAMYLIIQMIMTKRYPCHFSSTALTSTMGAIQATVVALRTNRDWSQWKLGWNMKLLVVSYSGIVGSGVNVALVAWCMHLRGPLFGSVFSPMALVFAALVGTLFLNEDLHAGSLMGAAVVVVGLYMVLWGKSKEMRRLNEDKKTKITLAEPTVVDHTNSNGNSDSNPESYPVEVEVRAAGNKP
ncbi:hypothetical protein MLD38_023193 [Melastoma candidum]|uniref:Uncharacterized protein n=1 Tax=Melastoma candidum TaxID=119954 RepID=A0ACB9QKV6_9MYRT|nr:hypothetical protein MLD38_023193 [Melastoma candidum]